jgi:hypothetical protein
MSGRSSQLSGLLVCRVDSSSDSGSGVHDRARDEPREDNDKSSEGGRLDLDMFRL